MTFALTSIIGFINGAGMFGAIIMLPLYLQIIQGATSNSFGFQPSRDGATSGGAEQTSQRKEVQSAMDKVTYSSDTTAAVPGARLSVARYTLAATGNSTSGYFGGGSSVGPNYSTLDKVTYSTDTTIALPGSGLLSVARSALAATGNSTAGYFGGGSTPAPATYSTMDKVTYSTDTTAAVPGAALSIPRQGLTATGNSTAGYFGGGFSSISTMDKVTYSSDTTAAVPGAALSGGRRGAASTGNSTAGYFGGGRQPTNVDLTTMDKISYSNDTRTTLPSTGSLSAARNYLSATGNSTAGYFGGGGASPRSTMDKLIYSSETTAAVSGAALSAARYGLAASSARANSLPELPLQSGPSLRFSDATPSPNTGYFGGGGFPARSTMDKVTYSSDTTAAVPGAALSIARYLLAATGSSTAGYFGGGGFPIRSTMDKVTYSTDTTAAVPGAALSVARSGLSATDFTKNTIIKMPTYMPLHNGLTYTIIGTNARGTFVNKVFTKIP